jgi:stage II sporulation protein AB (anti-sigma F factor)
VLLELTLPAETTSVPMARHALSDTLAEHVDDLLLLEVAVSEAVGNAVVHAYPDQAGEISVKAEVEGEQVLLEVRDWGGEIALDPLGSTGLGLGLALIAKVASTLTIRSNGGTHLLMWFPALS